MGILEGAARAMQFESLVARFPRIKQAVLGMDVGFFGRSISGITTAHRDVTRGSVGVYKVVNVVVEEASARAWTIILMYCRSREL